MLKLRIQSGLSIDHTIEGWSEFKKWINGTYSSLRYVWSDDGESYTIVAIDENVYRLFSINKEDAAEFEASYKIYRAAGAYTSDGKDIVANEKSDAAKVTFISHDWTDPTTWYETSVRIVDEVATNSGDDQRYTLAHNYIIDTYHGKITKEDYLKDANNYSYRVAVKVNDTLKTEQNPHYGSGGDYTINYDDGYIDFLTTLDPADEVKVTYHYMVNSIFTVKPDAGKNLKITLVEVQFSDDVDLKDSAVFQPYGYVDVFAPQLMPGIPSGTKIPLGNPVKYKTITDYQNDAVKAYATYPAMGGSSWRGSPRSIVVMDWDYVSSTVLKSSYGMEIRVSLEHNAPFNGFYATATFYCIAEDAQ